MRYFKKKSKYGNEKVVIDGIRFDSNAEGQRYLDLKLLVKAGIIVDLQLQKTFVLQEGYTMGGKKIQPITYKADFVYFDKEKGCIVVEDVKSKGTKTDVYRIKKKMFEKKYQIPIQEIMY